MRCNGTENTLTSTALRIGKKDYVIPIGDLHGVSPLELTKSLPLHFFIINYIPCNYKTALGKVWIIKIG